MGTLPLQSQEKQLLGLWAAVLGLMLIKQFGQGLHVEGVVFVHHRLAWFFDFGQRQRLPHCQERWEREGSSVRIFSFFNLLLLPWAQSFHIPSKLPTTPPRLSSSLVVGGAEIGKA